MDNLKPCPFCGGKAKYKYQMPYNAVQCTKCKVFGATAVDSYKHRYGKEKAIEAWNRRVTMENEKRLIDANALKDVFMRYYNSPHVNTASSIAQGMRIAIKTCMELIDNETTVDAVKVVRCKDCIRRYDTGECTMCYLSGGQYVEYTSCNSYCSRGERKDGDGNGKA